MKNKLEKTLFCAALAASVAAGAPMAVTASDAESAGEFVIAVSDGEISVQNETVRGIASAQLTAAESEEEPQEEDAGGEAFTLTLTEEDGTEHIFESVLPEAWTGPVLTESCGFLYIAYTDAQGDAQEALETAEEVEFEEPVTMWVCAEVSVCETADADAESLKTAAIGEEYTVTGAVPGWYKVQDDAISGYVPHTALTEDREAAEALAEAEAAAAAAAAAQEAAETAAEQTAAGQTSDSGDVTEVSRQAYDDCDGSGHGYYEITWSDGSVTYEDY